MRGASSCLALRQVVQHFEQREGRCVGGADAPSLRVEVVDAAAYAFARTERKATIAERDGSARGFDAQRFAPQVLQGLGVREGKTAPSPVPSPEEEGRRGC